MNNREIKISKYRNTGAYIFTGRDKGIEAREELKLNQYDREEGVVKVLIPSDIWGINSSFFGGLFEQSIKTLGEKFTEKYIFLYSNDKPLNETLKKDIADHIDYIMRNIS